MKSKQCTALVLLICTCICLSGYSAFAQDAQKWENFDAGNFDHTSVKIDNEYLPLKPGMRLVYTGTTVDDDEAIPHRVVINVTDLTKVINGVRALVTWDLDYSAGELAEAELAFYAEDKNGTVWRMGEHPEEYEEGQFMAAPTWLAGIQDAKAGISMKAAPKTGTPSYSQGYSTTVEFTDRGRVKETGLELCVPMGCYEDVINISETSEAEPDAEQFKYFAPGVGNVRVGWAGAGEKTQEVLELVDFTHMNAEALAEVRKMALELEKHAYEISKDVYGKTAPCEQMSMEMMSAGDEDDAAEDSDEEEEDGDGEDED